MSILRRRQLLWFRGLHALSGLGACAGASSDPGLRASLQIEGAQFVPGPLPAEGGGPAIISAQVPHAQVMPALRSERLAGALAADASAVLIALAGDAGYWIVTAGVPSFDEPDLPTFAATLWFARSVPPGPLALALSAADRAGNIGPRQILSVEAVDVVAAYELVVKLSWSNRADLDLHVLTPDGAEIWAGDVNSYQAPPPGATAVDPNAYHQGGVLDTDANADCAADGLREEDAVWSATPPSGAYRVRVATASLCGEAAAAYQVEVWLHGAALARAESIAVSSDTREPARRGAGTEVLTCGVQ